MPCGFSHLTVERCKVWKDSETLWTDVIDKYPQVSYAHYNRGHYYLIDKKYDTAFKDFNNAIKWNGNYGLAYMNRGVIKFRQHDDPRSALNDLNQAVELNLRTASLFIDRAAVHIALGNFDLALKDFDTALEIEPDHPSVFNNRGSFYFNKKQDYESALSDFNQAVRIAPDNGNYYMNRSRCYLLLGDKTHALEEARKARELGAQVGDDYMANLQE